MGQAFGPWGPRLQKPPQGISAEVVAQLGGVEVAHGLEGDVFAVEGILEEAHAAAGGSDRGRVDADFAG